MPTGSSSTQHSVSCSPKRGSCSSAVKVALYAVAASTSADFPTVVEASGAPLVTSALFSGECLTADGRIPWGPDALRALLPPGSLAIVPGGSPPGLALVLARVDHAPFVTAELDRLAALTRVAVATLGLLG